MRLLRLFSRVAFICNICFLLASAIQWIPHPPEGELVSTVIILGYILAILVNALVNLWLLAILILRKGPDARKGLPPRWLMIVNLLFFVLQLIILSLPTIQSTV